MSIGAASRRKLAAVPAKAAPRRFTVRPEWAYPTEANRAAYIAAVEWLRRGRVSRWLMDPDAARADYDDRDDGQQGSWTTEYEEWCREQDDEDEINAMLQEATRDDA